MNQNVFKRRVYIFSLIILIVTVLLIVKLFTLHFTSKIVVSRNDNIPVRRGYIKDRNGYKLALSIERDSLFANPQEIENPHDIAVLLSPKIDVPVKKLRKRLLRKKRFIWLKRKLDDTTVNEISRLSIKGLYFKKEYQRVYPHDTLAANIIGFVGIDNSGLEGIEYSYDSILNSTDNDGTSYDDGDIRIGKNISLTIDRFIQYTSEQELNRACIKYNAKQGAVAVLEINTGRVLALAKYPSFNPNYYYRYSPLARRSFTVIDSFEPGSTLKVISMASMLENKPGIQNLNFMCKGKIDIADETINCSHIHGKVDVSDIIRESCNVGIIEAAKSIKKQDLYKTLKRFGFGKKVGIELPGETNGILRPVNEWSGLSKYSISMGHELSVTSLQLVAAFSSIANNGIYIVPSIIESIENRNGDVIQSFYPRTKGRVLDPIIAKKLMKMMKGVVTGGTGTKADSVYYSVIGKTGTSKKFIKKVWAYSDRVVSSFIGIAPYKNPGVCILVVIDDPVDRLSGGEIAAPVFKAVVDRVLPVMGIKNNTVTAKIPLRGSREKRKFDGKRMPEFRGLRISEALGLLTEIQRHYNIEYSISGTGRVYTQRPAPGKKLKKSKKMIIYLRE